MVFTNAKNTESVQKIQLIDAAKQLLDAAGVDGDLFEDALKTLQVAQEQNLSITNPENKNYIDKTVIYEDTNDAFIYKRGDTVTGIWYFRMWNTKKKKAIFRSLKTTDKTKALATARTLYVEIKGKVQRGERLKQITTDELINLYIKHLETRVSKIPHNGITEGAFKSKKYWLRNWSNYIKELHLDKTPIDKIQVDKTREFNLWLEQRPKQTSLHTGTRRSRDQINNNVNCVIAMYNQMAVRERYISKDDIPQLDRTPYEVDESIKRDIPTNEEYEKYYTFLKRKYFTKKFNPLISPDELEKRKIFAEFILISANTGIRPKELLGLKKKEIKDLINQTEIDLENGNQVIHIRRENAKTGRSRRVVAPIKKRIERVFASYKKLGVNHKQEDFVFMNPNKNSKFFGQHFNTVTMTKRLKETLVASGLQKDLTEENRSLSLYSFRHFYAYQRLIHGVSIHLLAKNMGTSVDKIERTYGHINTELHSNEITRNQGFLKRTETIIDSKEFVV